MEVLHPVDRQAQPWLGIELLRDDGGAWVALERLWALPAGSWVEWFDDVGESVFPLEVMAIVRPAPSAVARVLA